MVRGGRVHDEASADLRRRAGARLEAQGHGPEDGLQHELLVHQIELEMQNEELRCAQVELEASRDRYFELYDLAPMGYCTLGEQGLILEANLATARMVGVPKAELAGKPLSRFIAKEDQDLHYLLMNVLNRTRDPQACDLRIRRPDGTTLWVRMEAVAARGPGGEPLQRAILVDIDERRRAQEALQAAREDLERRVADRTEEVRRMAVEATLLEEQARRHVARDLHDDLGQLLHAARLMAGDLSRIPSKPRRDARIGHLEAVLDRAGEVMRSLTTQLSPPVLDTLGLIPSLVRLGEDLQGTFDLRIRVEDDGRPKDTSLEQSVVLFRAVRELLVNVARHAGSGEVRVETRTDGSDLEIRVSDRGRGMGECPEVLAGFGLRNIRERIHQLQGDMSIVTAPGQGTTVLLRMPLRAGPGREVP
jgi:PAS domain S-box-containing protein